MVKVLQYLLFTIPYVYIILTSMIHSFILYIINIKATSISKNIYIYIFLKINLLFLNSLKKI